ncbi:MAG: DUF4279 domain-containing protein [Nitrospiraceae bacterium]|nr:DUF4279 domain-containing protein [Nitrospiraceae bacterium]
MSTKTFVRLKIISDSLTPTDIQSVVGISCDKSWKIGDFRANTIINEKNNGYIVDSGLSIQASLEEHLRNLLLKVTPYSQGIKSLSDDNIVEFSCVMYLEDNERPAIYFEKEIVNEINKLGASLDIDLYRL